MKTVHDANVHASAEWVFGIGADVERWPELDPAYRWCRILERAGTRTIFEMAGNIRGWPGRWTALQELFPGDRRILFMHLRGITTGMQVEWSLQQEGPVTRVRITHQLELRWPLIGRAVSNRIMGPIFIDWIARRTLSAVQRAAESRTNLAGSSDDTAATISQVRSGEHGGTA
jgi:ribosome-associated toxin RatA of RatAB toxin-antitoxin module